MKTLSELKEAIGRLPRKDLFALGEWMKELCEDAAFKDFALSSALRGMEDEPDLYGEEGGMSCGGASENPYEHPYGNQSSH